MYHVLQYMFIINIINILLTFILSDLAA